MYLCIYLFIYLFILFFFFHLPEFLQEPTRSKKSPGSLGIRLKQKENESAQLMFQKLIPRIDYGDQQLSLQYVCEENPLMWPFKYTVLVYATVAF